MLMCMYCKNIFRGTNYSNIYGQWSEIIKSRYYKFLWFHFCFSLLNLAHMNRNGKIFALVHLIFTLWNKFVILQKILERALNYQWSRCCESYTMGLCPFTFHDCIFQGRHFSYISWKQKQQFIYSKTDYMNKRSMAWDQFHKQFLSS